MIRGFDEETAPLTQAELALVPAFKELLLEAVGIGRAITNKQIIRKLASREMYTTGPRVRKIINHIRQYDIVPCLVASSKGYYVATTEQELLDYEDSLKGREKAIREVRERIEIQRKERFGGIIEGFLWG